MDFLSNFTKRLILSLGIGTMAVFTWLFLDDYKSVQNLQLQEKVTEIEHTLDYVCHATDYLVECDGDWDENRYKGVLASVVSKIDATSNLYAELFDWNFQSLSERTVLFEGCKKFDPKDYDELMVAFQTQNSGESVVKYWPGRGATVDAHVRWRWTPTDPRYEHRLLVIVGTSLYSVHNYLAGRHTFLIILLLCTSSVVIVGGVMLYMSDLCKPKPK
ncbi:MAG: hypothetical protein FWD31_02125 [Planctomycetaceae bacterium]|nr:hypothetical protein [Planctomycetaceae bacterium]